VVLSLVFLLVFSWLVVSLQVNSPVCICPLQSLWSNSLTCLVVYGDLKKALGATGGVEIAK